MIPLGNLAVLQAAVTLPVPPGASGTFHGRDVFAPAAARLAPGRPLGGLGAPAGRLRPLEFHRRGREGELVRTDRFGNLVSNLPPIPGRQAYQVQLGAFSGELDLSRTYADLSPARPGLVVSSAGTLEVAVRDGSAAAGWPGGPPGTGARLYAG